MSAWAPGKGWPVPLEPANLRAQILCWTDSRFVSADWWDKHSAITIDRGPVTRAPQQTTRRPVFGRRGAQ